MLVHLLLAAALATVPTAAPTAPVDGVAVAALVERYLDETGLPGVAVAVTRGRHVVHAGGHGRTATGEPVTERTAMPIASLSKSVTALAVLQLVEDGAVALDDPVREHLPEFAPDDPRADAVTVRQLLDQTSGLSDRAFPSASREQPGTLRESVAQLRTAGLVAEPGTHWEYHNPNYQVAARLVEVVSGRPFATHLREQIFAPLGMRDSRGIDTDRDLPPGPTGHVRVLGAAVPVREPAAFGAGSGGVLSSARDMAAWLIAQTDGTGPDGRSVATPATVATLHTPSSPASRSYALGWSVGTTAAGAPVVEHGGDLFTCTAHQALLPASGYGIAVLANTGPVDGDAGALAEQLVALVEGTAPPPAGSSRAVVDAALLALAAGTAWLAVRGVRRADRWAARRRSVATALLRTLPLLAPTALLLGVHRVFGVLYRGRDLAWVQVLYLYPLLVLLLVVAAGGGAGVAVARVAQAARGSSTSGSGETEIGSGIATARRAARRARMR
ncbi:serine hydrolase domain-containing protein [Pseudonocardia humida]|uniref:Beta-lactamase family protein n=1 Tax=Pseudonocardia humida TaxID=2800819 RepID=A0ABT1A0T9_9PSEU|nr:serine hydrolase domain-containing protein [Pseudonocardia humida]MCO1656525.1 beta-lactamase family protein [Pseudonocardia humida]